MALHVCIRNLTFFGRFSSDELLNEHDEDNLPLSVTMIIYNLSFKLLQNRGLAKTKLFLYILVYMRPFINIDTKNKTKT